MCRVPFLVCQMQRMQGIQKLLMVKYRKWILVCEFYGHPLKSLLVLSWSEIRVNEKEQQPNNQDRTDSNGPEALWMNVLVVLPAMNHNQLGHLLGM